MLKIEWDKEYNGVRLVLAGSKETVNIAPRPVFFEELDLLGLDELGWKYPKCEEPLLWSCDRRYFYKGVEVMVVKGGNLYDNPIIEIKESGKDLKLIPVDLHKLRKRNERLLNLLEFEAMNFIIDTFRRYSNKKIENLKPDYEIDFLLLAETLEKNTKEKHVVFKEDCDSFDIMPVKMATEQGKRIVHETKIEKFLVSYSGGKDSQVLLDLVARALPPSEFFTIFSDTGYELPSTHQAYEDTIRRYQSQSDDFKFYTARNHESVMYYWDQIGSPSNVHRWCCSVMKTAPLYKMVKEINGNGKQPKVLTFDGVRAEESESRAGYARIGKAVKHNNVINARPILYWNETEIFLYILLNKIELNNGYRNGYDRVGCIICPFGTERSDFLANKLHPLLLKPYIEKLNKASISSGIQDVEEYIKTKKWKLRAGNRGMDISSKIEIITSYPDFKAVLFNPKTDILEWLKVLGSYKIRRIENTNYCELFYKGNVYQFQFTINENKNITVYFPNIGNEVVFLGLFKRILYKTTYCIHCESCEVECPTGALNVVNDIVINESKCTHCFRCLNFCEKGCIVANYLSTSNSSNMNNANFSGSVDRYNTFGFRETWIKKFLSNYNDFFESNEHGLNEKKQIPAFAKWLVDAELLQKEQKISTRLTQILSSIYLSYPQVLWEVLWINISKNSRICNWFVNNIEWNSYWTRDELIEKLTLAFPQYQGKTLANGLQALLNTFKESPLGEEFGHAILQKKLIYSKQPKHNISKIGISYILYKYAEMNNNYSLRVSQMMRFENEGSVFNLFGIDKLYFEAILRTLHSEKEPVLHADLKMGLDNISLRPELNSIKVLEIMLNQI